MLQENLKVPAKLKLEWRAHTERADQSGYLSSSSPSAVELKTPTRLVNISTLTYFQGNRSALFDQRKLALESYALARDAQLKSPYPDETRMNYDSVH